jgi:phenylacetate-coenzyme A ligase PaaK-like adenylate-forming protein
VATAGELLRQGRKSQIWQKYCGFLDLNINEFMQIQESLLLEEIHLIANTEIGKHFFGDWPPTSIAEFRRRVPVTTYEDFAPFLDGKQDQYPDVYEWAHTSGRSGQMKWVPYTRQAFTRLGEDVLAQVILGAAREKGEVRLEEGQNLVYNTPPRPYISGVTLRAVAEQFNFHFIPSLEETEKMDFQERIAKSFDIALDSGIDVLGSIASVLVKMGERFAQSAQGIKITRSMLKPRVIYRLLKGFLRSKIERRPMLPRDLWNVKVIPAGGADTELYREKIAHYWGVQPISGYACTEAGVMGTQTWNRKYMTFYPGGAFYEFIPMDEWTHWRNDSSYSPKTVLLNEVRAGQRYEVVITNYYGKPLLRYRTYDIITFPALEDIEAEIHLPQMMFVSRAPDFIDIGGFIGMLDEKVVWQAIINTGLDYEDWVLRKESVKGDPVLHLYIEMKSADNKEVVRQKVHEALIELNHDYADYNSMIEKNPLEVSILLPGSFRSYSAEKVAAGADLAHLKPPHMNPSDAMMRILMKFNEKTPKNETGGKDGGKRIEN